MHVRYAGMIALLAVAAAACGSSGSKAGSNNTSGGAYGAPQNTAAPATTAPAAAAATPVKVANVGGDTLMVDANGLTVYAFSPDTTTTSACNAGCDSNWPPVTVAGTAPTTVSGLPITTLTRGDGATQLVVNGHPVYTFSGDSKPGDTNGEGVGGKWYYVNEKGEPDKG